MTPDLDVRGRQELAAKRYRLGRRIATLVLSERLGITEARASAIVRDAPSAQFWSDLAGLLLELEPGRRPPPGEGTET